jgi:hypothetical protein
MNLESYIRKNRNKLDVEKPDEDYLWTGISQAMNGTKKRKHIVFWRYVAAASVILFLSATITYVLHSGGRQQLIFVNIDPKLADQEAQFKDQINSYSELIKQTSFNDNKLATGNSEIQYIDVLINHYSEDLKQNGPNPKLINSLMDLYRKKIMLLERMLNEIEKSKKDEKRKIII